MSQAQMIKVWDITGGIHPPENKAQSMALPLADFTIPKELVFPVSQHLGTPASPIVSVGDKVLAGQKIAEPVGAMSAAIHASTSGIISAIEERILPHISGMTGLCIVLESDGQHTTATFDSCEDYRTLAPAELIQKIRHAGIAGLGGAGFPTAIKLAPHSDHKIDTLILNGTECEPYITADDRLMQDFADDVVSGAELLAFILGNPQRVVIGIEDNKPDAIKAITAAAQSTTIEVATFPTKYPSGGEKQLIQILTGQEVPSGKIPATLGIVVQNVGTAMAAHRAVHLGEPLTWRITTIVGESLKTQRNAKVLLGTPVSHLLEQHQFNASDCSRLIMGGPMMGFALPSTDVPVVKTTNCIIAPTRSEMPDPPPAQACIRCGMCAEACPASLLPQQLYWYAKSEDYERLQNHNLFDCIECGACSYVCPSTIPLVQYYRAAKGTIRQQEQEKTKSDHARQRFEFRKLRIEHAEQEKEAKRLARKKAAEKAKRLAAERAEKTEKTGNKDPQSSDSPTNATDDPVAAAMERVKAKQQDPTAQKAKLERAISSAQSRVEKLQQRLNDTDDDQKEKLTAQLKQAQLRLQEAEKNKESFSVKPSIEEGKEPPAKGDKKSLAIGDKKPLATGDKKPLATEDKKPSTQTGKVPSINGNEEPSTKPSENQTLKPAPSEALNAADAAIKRAKAKAAAMAKMSPEEKLKSQLASLETRVRKAREKLQKAETEGSKHVDALRTGLEKMEAKLANTQTELESL